ncbi:WhiB family transcriptional regulator [Streptomyces sp. NPDC005708]|jgi:WhiB family redox-sensing transcriptional regulator|uniref:WhiB family transcriptional regulator n=1 Tax=unclassified Streptomyces TaxID=2593676 RepID=UPI0033E01114
MEWLRHAACVGEDPELFFPVGSTGPYLVETAAAKRVCRRCPVMAECLDWALRTGQTAGVWGGTDEKERARLLRTTKHRSTTRRSTR